MSGLMPFWDVPCSKVLILNYAQTYKLGVTCPNLTKSCANSAPSNVTVLNLWTMGVIQVRLINNCNDKMDSSGQ